MSSTITHKVRSVSSGPTSMAVGTKATADVNKLRLRGENLIESLGAMSKPSEKTSCPSEVEQLADLLFSERHLRHILISPPLLSLFATFLSSRRPQSIGILVYYLDVLKALKAVRYANAISKALKPLQTDFFTADPPQPVGVKELEDKAETAFRYLLEEDLPAYITYLYSNAVTKVVRQTHSGFLHPPASDILEDIVETFFLTDSSKPDNPIAFVSDSFHSMTQHHPQTAFGKHIRILYGERTKLSSIIRIEEAYRESKEHSELILNYRSDGSVYLNLLHLAPLCDSRGKVRYFLAYQIDVGRSIREAGELQFLKAMFRDDCKPTVDGPNKHKGKSNELKDLSEMLSSSELHTIQMHGGRMHSGCRHASDPIMNDWKHGHHCSLEDQFLVDVSASSGEILSHTTKPTRGPYRDYLLLRPFPSLRILFVSPSLRVPGILQSPFLSRIGGSRHVRESLTGALAAGQPVTVKVRWATNPKEEARTRWINCTPLKGRTGCVGVWVVVLLDEPKEPARNRRGRTDTVSTVTNGDRDCKTDARTIRRRKSDSQCIHTIGKTRCRAATPSRNRRVEEWRGTCWREDDDESEDEFPDPESSHFKALSMIG